MSENKENLQSGENSDESTNNRREFIEKAAMAAAGLAVGAVVSGNDLFAQAKPQKDEIIIIQSDAIARKGTGSQGGGAGTQEQKICLCDANKPFNMCLCNVKALELSCEKLFKRKKE